MMKLLFALLLSFGLFAESSVSTNNFTYPLNTQNVEYNPVISPNGKYIIFQSNRPGGEGGMDFWLSENKNYRDRTGNPIWMEPVNLRDLNTPGFEGPFSVLFDAEGKPAEIYFTSLPGEKEKRQGRKGHNIYFSKRITGTDNWEIPVHLMDVNSDFDDKMPAISPDGKTLVFSSNRPGGFGGFDLWISDRITAPDAKIESWSNPINLGEKINSSSNEIMPYFHYDGLTLFFSSDRKDENHKYSFYKIDFEEIYDKKEESEAEVSTSTEVKRSVKFKDLMKLPKPFNSAMDDEGVSLTHDGLWVYYASNRDGGEGQFDIYRVRVPEELRKPYLFNLNGLVIDGSEDTMIGVSSTIKIYSDKGLVRVITSKRIGGDISRDNPKNFETQLFTNTLYKIEVSAPDFYPTEFSLDLRGTVGAKKSKYVKIVLMPIKTDDDTEKEPEKDITNDKEKEIDKPVSDEPVVEKKSEQIQIILRDLETKKEIAGGSVRLFTEKLKEGILLQKDKTAFLLDKRPEGAFELLGRSPEYQDETLIIKEGELPLNDKKQIDIFLRKLKESEKIYKTLVYFEFNEYKLLDDHKKVIDKIASFLKINTLDTIEVGGHTDNIASKEFNLKLSQKRADTIKAYLVSKGIDEKRIKAVGYWYSQPQAENDSEEGRAKNRRVGFKKLN